jgi:hypothetical protein
VEHVRHPSEDRAAYLSVSESPPASGPPISTSNETISPRMSRDPRASAPDLAKGGGSPRGIRQGSCEGSSAPSSVGAPNRTVSPRILRGVRLDPTKGRAHPPRLALPTERYRRGSSEVSVLIRRRFVRTLLGWRRQPNGIVEDPPRCPSRSGEGSCAPSSVGAANRTVSPGILRGVRLDPTKVRTHPLRLAPSTERYRRGCSEVSVLIRRRFVPTLLGWRRQPNGIADDVPRYPS